MHVSPRKFSCEIDKVFSLSSTLCVEDQIKFLDVLISTEGLLGKMELIDQALVGVRVWEQQQVG